MCNSKISNFPANYISYEPTVRFGDTGYLVEKFNPYYEIVVVLSEINKCPFCGQVVELSHKCNCDEYKKAFENLLKNYGCGPIKSMFQQIGKNPVFYRTVDEISSRLLKKQEIDAFDADFWDFSILYPVCGKKGFRLVNPSYDFDSQTLQFYWKDLATKSVFLCSLQGLEVETNKRLFLRETVYNGGNASYKQLAEYRDWNAFCEVLKKL